MIFASSIIRLGKLTLDWIEILKIPKLSKLLHDAYHWVSRVRTSSFFFGVQYNVKISSEDNVVGGFLFKKFCQRFPAVSLFLIVYRNVKIDKRYG